MPKILVSPLSLVAEVMRHHRPSHLVTLLDPEGMLETPEGLAPERHLRLGVNDIAEARPDAVAPAAEHVRALIGFAEGWDARAPMLVHCWAGVSRSTAAAFTVLCRRRGPGSEMEIARELRARAPHAQPNRLMVHHADALLGRGGRMIAAVEAMGPGRVVWEGELVELPLAFDAP